MKITWYLLDEQDSPLHPGWHLHSLGATHTPWSQPLLHTAKNQQKHVILNNNYIHLGPRITSLINWSETKLPQSCCPNYAMSYFTNLFVSALNRLSRKYCNLITECMQRNVMSKASNLSMTLLSHGLKYEMIDQELSSNQNKVNYNTTYHYIYSSVVYIQNNKHTLLCISWTPLSSGLTYTWS